MELNIPTTTEPLMDNVSILLGDFWPYLALILGIFFATFIIEVLVETFRPQPKTPREELERYRF